MDLITIVIETPRQSTGKYFYHEKDTRSKDDNLLDAMVIAECDIYPGVQIKYRVIGALLANHRSPGKKLMRNDRFFFIPRDSLVYEHIKDIKGFSKRHKPATGKFFHQL